VSFSTTEIFAGPGDNCEWALACVLQTMYIRVHNGQVGCVGGVMKSLGVVLSVRRRR
jgi:hypothetical protein